MSRTPTVHLKPSASDFVIRRYLAITILRFNQEMGTRLAEVRLEKMNLTQRQLADRLGLTQTDVSRIEQGKIVYALPYATEFKKVLGERFDYVCFGGVLLEESLVTIENDKSTQKYWARLK